MKSVTINPGYVTSDSGLTREVPVYKFTYFNKRFRRDGYNVIPSVGYTKTLFITAGKSSYDCDKSSSENPDGFTIEWLPIEKVLSLFYSEAGHDSNYIQIISMELIAVAHYDGDCSSA